MHLCGCNYLLDCIAKVGIHAVCVNVYMYSSVNKQICLSGSISLCICYLKLCLTSFQSSITDLPSSFIIIQIIISTHSIVHTDPDDVCGDGLQSSDTVCGSIGNLLLIVLNVHRDISRITIFNIVEEIWSSCYHI